MIGPPSARRDRPPAAAKLLPLACAAILMLLVVANGYPLLYDDTTAYMRRSAGAVVALLGPGYGSEWLDVERLSWLQASLNAPPVDRGAAAATAPVPPWTSGRSVYYGLVVYALTLAGGLWAAAAFQALAAGVLLYLAWFRVLGLTSVRLFLLASLALTFFSSLGYFVGLIMPDVFAGLTILASGVVMTGWRRLGLAERVIALAILSFSLLAHDTHLLVGAGLFALFLASGLVAARGRGFPPAMRAPAAAIAASLLVGVLGVVAYHQAAVRITGQPPLRLPHITAHMASLEPSSRFLQDRCRREDWAVCRHASQLPITWIDFMFGKPDIYDQAPDPEKRRLSEEQLGIAAAMLADRPATTAWLMASEAAKQLVTFSYFDLGQREMLRKDVPGPVLRDMRNSALVRRPGLTHLLSGAQQIAVALCFALLLVLAAVTRDRRGSWPAARTFAGTILVGVVLNAVVCGVLAYPYDRFQARVMWLIPFAALFCLALLFQRRASQKGRQP